MSGLRSSGFQPDDGLSLKFEIEDTIKLEQHHSDNSGDDKNFDLPECRTLEGIHKNVKSDDFEVVDCAGSHKHVTPELLGELKSDIDAEDPESLDFEREIQEFHVKNRIDVKLETEEFIIKHETVETDNNLQTPRTGQQKDQSKGSYRCNHCNYEPKKRRVLTAQMMSCDHSDFHSKNKESLNHDGSFSLQLLKCEICDYQTKNKHNLKRHTERHSKDKKCQNCSFRTKYQSRLHIHSAHCFPGDDLLKYCCKVCNHVAETRALLMTHEATHTNSTVNRKLSS